MTNVMKKIVDISTGEEIERQMTAKELSQIKADKERAEAELLAQEQAEAQLLAKLESAKAKLGALGLTPEEISAITGA